MSSGDLREDEKASDVVGENEARSARFSPAARDNGHKVVINADTGRD